MYSAFLNYLSQIYMSENIVIRLLSALLDYFDGKYIRVQSFKFNQFSLRALCASPEHFKSNVRTNSAQPVTDFNNSLDLIA